MHKIADSDLWKKAIELATAGVDNKKAFKDIRIAGGRDLTKPRDGLTAEESFNSVYEKFKVQPLFTHNFLRTIERAEFQSDVIEAMLRLTPTDDDNCDELMDLVQNFEKGSGEALVECLSRMPEPDKSTLSTRARTLYARMFAQIDARDAARAKSEAESKQLALPLESVVDQAVPELPAEV